MDFEKLTNKSKELVQDVVNLASRKKHQYIAPEHLLKVLLDDKDGLITGLLENAGGNVADIRRAADDAVERIPQVSGAAVQSLMSQDFTRVMQEAEKLADKAGDWQRLGLWAGRLMFTTENARECVQVLERYLGRGSYQPNDYTRGLYYRGVE